jgi:hypothetical protein
VHNRPIILQDPQGTEGEKNAQGNTIAKYGVFESPAWKAGLKKAFDKDPLVARILKERAEEHDKPIREDVQTILDAVSVGAVEVTGGVKDELNQLLQHPSFIDLGDRKLTVEDPKILHILAVLATKAKQRFLEEFNPYDDHPKSYMAIATLFKANERRKEPTLHERGLAADISIYDKQALTAKDPKRLESWQKLISDLPAGDYGVGLPRLPLKTNLDSAQAHEDAKRFPDLYEPTPPGYSPKFVVPNARLLAMHDDILFDKGTNAWKDRGLKIFRPTAEQKMRAFTANMDNQGIFVRMYFSDGFDHIHLSAVGPKDTHF